jgi:hypothetical protein
MFTFSDSKVFLIQDYIYFKILHLEYFSIFLSSKNIFKSFFLRLQSIRNVSTVFEKSNNFFISSDDKLLIALNMKYIKNTYNDSLVVVKKINLESYNFFLSNFYSCCFLYLFNILFLPLVKVRSNRFSNYLESTSSSDFSKFLFFYEHSYKYFLEYKFDLIFTSKTRLWLKKNIPFDNKICENYLFFFDRLKLLTTDFNFILFSFIIGGLVRLRNVFYFISYQKL